MYFQDRMMTIVVYSMILFLCFTIYLMKQDMPDPSSFPGSIYRPDAKFIMAERLQNQLKCISLCESGNYYHHHLKQTRMAKCNS